jgi:2-(1,2-epoxy-1,2-dihydrophenyl)acetyl-CoA isomerase
MTFEHILLEKWDSVSVLRMNRPQSLNALSTGHLTDIVKGLEICAEDDEVRCVVLTGQGRAFCSGGDISEFRESLDTNPSEPLRQIIKLLNIAILAIRTMRKPVLAAINGAAGGAGISLAAACDLRLCAASARFRQAYTSLGLVPDGAWALLVPLLIGFSRANELIFLDTVFEPGRPWSGGSSTASWRTRSWSGKSMNWPGTWPGALRWHSPSPRRT